MEVLYLTELTGRCWWGSQDLNLGKLR
jgi:hypothetical protein